MDEASFKYRTKYLARGHLLTLRSRGRSDAVCPHLHESQCSPLPAAISRQSRVWSGMTIAMKHTSAYNSFTARTSASFLGLKYSSPEGSDVTTWVVGCVRGAKAKEKDTKTSTPAS
jgi:hypothetical protein